VNLPVKNLKNKNNLLRNIFPGFFLAWLFYLTELCCFGSLAQIKSEWLFELKVFLFYQLICIVAYLIGTGIITPKTKKYQTFYESGRQFYSVQSLKSMTVALSFLLLFLLRAIVAKPSLFTSTVNAPHSILSNGLDFIISGFSPLYFSVLILGFLLFFLYRISESISSALNFLKVIKFLVAALVCFAFLFSYEALHAKKSEISKNLFFFGFNQGSLANLENPRTENPTPLLDSLISNSYRCENYYTSAAEPFAQFAAITSGLQPLSSGIVTKEADIHNINFTPHLWKKLTSAGYQVVAVLPENYSRLLDKFKDPQITVITPSKTENSTLNPVLRHPLLLGFINHRFLINHIFPEYSKLPQCQLTDYLTDRLNSEIDKNRPLALFYFSSSSFYDLPYPYHRMPENSALQLLTEHTVSGILQQFTKESSNSLIVINSLPDTDLALNTEELKQKLYCYDSKDIRRKGVKSYFSGADLGAIILDLLNIDTLNYPGEKRNFANAATLPEDILVTESWSHFAHRKNINKKSAGLTQLEKNALFQYYTSYAKKTLIAGHRKFDYLPQDSGVVTSLIYLDKQTSDNLSIKNHNFNLSKMNSVLEELHCKSGFKSINGYFIK